MIELFASSKNTIIHSVKSSSHNSKSTSFQDQLDTSISQQKSLKEEIQQQKTSHQKKKNLNLSTQLENLKKDLAKKEADDLESLEQEKTIESLVIITDFLENLIDFSSDIEDVSMEQGSNQLNDMDISILIDNMQLVVSQTLQSLQNQQQVPSMMHNILEKTVFMLESINFNNYNNSDLFTHYQASFQAIDNDIKGILIPTELAMDNSQEISIDLELMDVDELLSQHQEFSQNNSDSSKEDSQQFDQSKFNIVDTRTKNTQTVKNEQMFELPQTLESIDSFTETVQSTPLTQNPVVAKHNQIVEQLYSSLSSSVSRVQLDAMMQNMAGKISMILQDGGHELQMKLTPPELGNMKLSFISEDGMMRGKIVVETPEAKMLFEQNINNLRESLANAGVSLGSVDIEFGMQQDFSSSKEESSESSIQAVRQSHISKNESENIIKKSMTHDVLVDFTA